MLYKKVITMKKNQFYNRLYKELSPFAPISVDNNDHGDAQTRRIDQVELTGDLLYQMYSTSYVFFELRNFMFYSNGSCIV
jgi:hypothetical protein